MKLNKIKGAVLASIIVLSVGVLAIKVVPTPLYAKVKETSILQPTKTVTVKPIVVSSTKYKEVTLLTKSDIKQITGFELTSKNITSIYNELKSESAWEMVGYSERDAELIANRFTKSYKQSIGILKKLAKISKLNLKVVIIDKPNYQNANIGVSNNDTKLELPTITPTVTPTPSTEVVKSSLKELEISIDYKNGDIELEYEVDIDGTIEAEYQNDFTGEELQGKDAKAIIENILSGLDIKNSNQATIVNHILSKLNVEKGYKQFQFKAEFYDGKEIEFEK